MFKLLTGFLAGVFAGYYLVPVIPNEFFIAACIALLMLAAFLFILLHFGLRDFQEY